MACVSDGTALTLADPPGGSGSSNGSYQQDEDGSWVYVSTAAGLSGWASASYLDWA